MWHHWQIWRGACGERTVTMLQTHTLAYSLSRCLTHCLRQLTVSSPLCHIKDAASLWASDDTETETQIYTCTSCQSSTEWVGCCVGGYPACLFVCFLHTMCEKFVCKCVCTQWCLFALQVVGEPVIHYISHMKSWGTHTHARSLTHTKSKQSQNSAILNPISVRVFNLSLQWSGDRERKKWLRGKW